MNLIILGIILMIISLSSPWIFHHYFRKISAAGRFWTMYIGTFIGIILIFVGILK